MQRIDANEAAQLLMQQDDILILTHSSPDGDTLGCGFALLRALEALGKTARVACGDAIPQKYAYMWQGLTPKEFTPRYVVAVDIADLQLIGKELRENYGDKIDLCMDHHRSNTGYANNLCLEECAAACEIIYAVILSLGVVLDKPMADCLYTGISTDTGCFRYANVTPRTHQIAAELIGIGADAGEINRVMFETRTKAYLRLQSMALSSIEMYENDRCAFVLLTQKMFQESGCSESECDGISSIPRKIEGVLAGVTVREKEDGSFKVSLRTHNPVDASEVCKKMGGGGHARAAGCTLDGTRYQEEKAKLLSIIAEEIQKI